MKTKIKNIIIKNMTSPRSGREVANQFKITTSKGDYFISYSTVIAFISNNGKTYLDKNSWNYSTTTSKYRNQFLGENTKTTKEKIEFGEYSLVDLNN